VLEYVLEYNCFYCIAPTKGRYSSGRGHRSQRLVSEGTDTIPGKAAALTKTYSDQANFVPFIVETSGRINAAGSSRILPLEADGTAGLTRRHGRAALRGISRALATCLHRLPRRYTRLPDRAAQGTGERGNSDYQDLGLEVDDDDPTDG
jgi:hypothetical protein